MRKIIFISFLILSLAFSRAISVEAKDNADNSQKSFYEGKVLVIVCYAPPGGGYDFYARLLARHIPKYIPGKPRVVVKSMPGGGGIVAGNYVYNQVEPNGLTLGAFSGTLHLMQLINHPGIQYDMNKYIPVGGMEGLIYPLLIGIMRTDTPYTSVEAIVQAIKEGKKPPTMANAGKGSAAYTRAKLLEAIVPGLEFKYVLGYSGATTSALAIRRKETDGCLFGAPESFRELVGDLYKDGKVTVLVHASPPELDELPGFPGIPPIWKYAKTDKDRMILKYALYKPGRPFYVTPGTPKERVDILRTAFIKAGNDPGLLKEAKKANRPITPTPGEEISQFFKEFFTAPPDIKQFIKETFG